MKTKICSNPDCLQPEKPLSEFYKDKHKKDGHRPDCKACVNYRHKMFRLTKIPEYILYSIKNRCNDKNNKDYGGRGIECKITLAEIISLMERDNYYKLKKPSIDRIDNKGNYELGNCGFIEMNINGSKDKRKIVLQYDLQGKFIREWESIREIQRILKNDDACISECCNGRQKTSGGFIWKFKERRNG